MSSKPKNIIKKKNNNDNLDNNKLIKFEKEKCGIYNHLPPQVTHPPEPYEYLPTAVAKPVDIIPIQKSVEYIPPQATLTELKERIITLEKENKHIKAKYNELCNTAYYNDMELEKKIKKIEKFLYNQFK